MLVICPRYKCLVIITDTGITTTATPNTNNTVMSNQARVNECLVSFFLLRLKIAFGLTFIGGRLNEGGGGGGG